MILTITPNAAVDRTYCIENFALNRVNRPSLSHQVAGGKGINVARVYSTLGGKVIAGGFLGGRSGRTIYEALAAEQIPADFVQTEGESRTCIAIIDPRTGTQTEVNENGPTVSPQNVRDLLRRVSELVSQHSFEFVVLSGSLPPGAPETLYADLITLTRKQSIRAVLDSSGDALRVGVDARPWLIKPNKTEMERLLGRQLNDDEAALSAAQEVAKLGVEVVALSLGDQGAIAVTNNEVWRSHPPRIDFVSAVASGDSFLAAFLWQWTRAVNLIGVEVSNRLEESLCLATAAGAANASVIGAGFCTRDEIAAAYRGTRMHRIAFT